MENKDELIRRAALGRKIADLIGLEAVKQVYEQTRAEWGDQILACDPHDTTAMLILRGMRDGVEAFWTLLGGLVEIGKDAEREAAGDAPDAQGRVIQ